MNQEGISGFQDQDCKTTAEFIQLHNDLLDVLNSKKLSDPGYKQARTEKNALQTAQLFDKIRAMYDSLEARVPGADKRKIVQKKILQTLRFTGFLGLLTAMDAVQRIIGYMSSKKINITFLCCYKLVQDHLEIFFNAVRLRNGWSYILTCRQFRYALRQLITHAGKAILTSACSNCVPQDETQILMIKNLDPN